MTISTTATADFSIARLILLAHRAAGFVGAYQSLTTEQLGHGSLLLELITKKLHTKGIFAKVVEFTTVELTGGTFQYTMDADALDIVGPGMFLDSSQTDLTQASGETLVAPMLRDEWQTLSAKNAEGPPTRYFLNRETTPPVIYFWPVPGTSEDGAHVRLQKHRLRATMLDTTKTIDFETYWELYFVYALAHELAVGVLPLERVTYFALTASTHLKDCLAYSKQRGPQQMVFNHPTRWRSES